jgi:hypothetical protein
VEIICLNLSYHSKSIRNSINRQSPLGDENWVYMVSKKYNLESTINPIGRPKREVSCY